MGKFTDNQGQVWILDSDYEDVEDVKKLLDFDLLSLDSGSEIKKMMSDRVLLVNVVYVLCREQAEKLSISDREFGRRLKGDPFDEATRALLEDLTTFFPKRKRDVLLTAIKEIWEMEDRLTVKAEQMVQGGLKDLLAAEEKKATDKMQAALVSPGGNASTSGPASSG